MMLSTTVRTVAGFCIAPSRANTSFKVSRGHITAQNAVVGRRTTAPATTSCATLSTTSDDPPENNSNEGREIEASVWDKPDLQRIFDNNREWRKQMLQRDPDFFKKLSEGQTPEYLLIGCSDSRVGAQEIMGLHQGELFVHRNIANIFVPTDINLLSVLFYAVNVLKVKEILVMGHYECGGVRAASQNKDLGLIDHWLHNIRDVQRLHKDELQTISDPDQRHRRLVELNIQEQCFNLFGNSIVQQMQAKTGRPRIHGLVYDIANGRLKYLNIDFKTEIRKYRDIYSLADFRRHAPINIAHIKAQPDNEETGQEKKEIVQLLFDVIDTDKDGTIGREEIREAAKKFDLPDVSEDDLDEAMQPLVGMSREEFDKNTFATILESLHDKYDNYNKVETDRLVVIRPSSGQDPPRPLRCSASTTIHELKVAIHTLTGTPVERQSLYHEGRKLKDDEATLADVGIADITEVQLTEELVPAGFKRPTKI